MKRSISRTDYGNLAEDLAAEHLVRNGHIIIAKNFRRRGSEIDLISKQGDFIVFVEVKARHSRPTTLEELSQLLPKRKQVALKRGALAFLAINENFNYEGLRFDLVVVTKNKVTDYFTNAF